MVVSFAMLVISAWHCHVGLDAAIIVNLFELLQPFPPSLFSADTFACLQPAG